MRYGKKYVEQVNSQGEIVQYYDTSLNKREIYEKVELYFPHIRMDGDGMLCGEYEGKSYAIRVKNITYLGNPHPLYKKRIQIAEDLKTFYADAIRKDYIPLLLGIYTFEDNILFCDFNIYDFLEKKAHNSSAHVYSSDLVSATLYDYFQKTDAFGNEITVFSPKAVDIFLEETLKSELRPDMKTVLSQIRNKRDSLDMVVHELDTSYNKVSFMIEKAKPHKDNVSCEMIKLTKEEIAPFFKTVPVRWDGIKCYNKMIEADYHNKFQPEWVGFYFEFEFEQYLKENCFGADIRYAQDKSGGGIDLDLFFPALEVYGDLKAHSSHSRGVQGNDWETVFSILSSKKKELAHVYYIVCVHDTVKDSECGYEVTRFWNKVQNKDNEMSYSKRMKNHVTLNHWYVLDINPENAEYLSLFKQGINSNGKPRNPKIMIEESNFDKFILAEGKIE